MKQDHDIILRQLIQKNIEAIALVESSLDRTREFDIQRKYKPEEREPYDALCDRFIRAVELGIKFFKAYEKKCMAKIQRLCVI